VNISANCLGRIWTIYCWRKWWPNYTRTTW